MGSDPDSAHRSCFFPSFNSRSRVGSDAQQSEDARSKQGFNSRSRVGSDLCERLEEESVIVSIRAPAWGATRRRCRLSSRSGSFNSRSRVGSDAVKLLPPSASSFQFALPRGERPRNQGLTKKRFKFQFALPRGERLGATLTVCVLHLFQFALPRGERRGQRAGYRHAGEVSIRAPAWGATTIQMVRERAIKVSIRAPAWGATTERQSCKQPSRSFNSRSRVGSDCCCCARCRSAWRFNSRSRVGSDNFTRINSSVAI